MRRLDWLLVAVALTAIVVGWYLNGPICGFRSAPFGQAAPLDCRFRFPLEIMVGLAVAVLAVIAIGLRIRRRRRSAVR